MSRKRSRPSRYKVWMRPAVHSARKKLPGHIRQRIKRKIEDLGSEPRPSRSKRLRLPPEVGVNINMDWEVRRIRIANWRIVYAISETWKEIAILAIHQRPPYEYEDLEDILSDLWPH